MGSLTAAALAPFAYIFNVSYRHPMLAIAISAAAGLIAHLMDHDGWAVLFVCFLSYLLIWYDETHYPRAAEQGSVEE
jgi:uncharacterized membrane protein YjjP (DUF1212 family)